MVKPRPEKVAVVEEVRNLFESSTSAVLTEYRGLTVTQMESLRRSLATTGTSYKIYKNTLVKRAIAGTAHESLGSLLDGPNAIAFSTGDLSETARTLKTFSGTNEHLLIKGGVYEGAVVTREQLISIADLPSRDVLLARLAGSIAAPLRQMAGLLAALPTNLAYGLKALLDSKNQAGTSDEHSEPTSSSVQVSATPEPTSATEPTSASEPTSVSEPESEPLDDEALPDESATPSGDA